MSKCGCRRSTASLIDSPGVSGLRSWRAALHELLAGTGLAFRASDRGALVVEVEALTEALEVTGRMPGVTSPKLTEPLRDIPQTITVISSQVIEEQGANTLRDVLRNVAGITFQAGEGGVPAGDTLTMRGFSARTDMFVDGVRDVGGYSRDAFNLAQLEVAKGPTSSIAGRGSTGGAINQVSKTPDSNRSFSGTMGAGTAGYLRSTVDLNQPLPAFPVPGTALRLNAMWTDTDTPNRDQVHASRWGVAPSLGLGMGTHTRATVSSFSLRQDNLPEYGLPWVPANTNPELQAFANSAPPVDRSNYYGLVGRDYERTDTDVVTVDVAHDLGGATTLRNLTRWGRNVRDSVITAPRFVAVNASTGDHAATAIARHDRRRSSPIRPISPRGSPPARSATRSRRPRGLGRDRRRTSRASGPPLLRPTSSIRIRSIRIRGRSCAAARARAARPTPSRPMRSIPSTSATHWELTGGLRWDRFAVDYTSVAVTGVATPLSRTDAMISGRGGDCFQAPAAGQHLCRLRHLLQPVGRGPVADRRQCQRRARDDAERRSRHQVGSVPPAAVCYRRRVLHREDQRPHARRQSRRSRDGAGGQAARRAASRSACRAGCARWWTALANYAFMTQPHRGLEHRRRARSEPRAHARAHAVAVDDRDAARGIGLSAPARSSWTASSAMPPTRRGCRATGSSARTASYAVNSHLTLRLNGNNLADAAYVDRIGGGHTCRARDARCMLTATVTR